MNFTTLQSLLKFFPLTTKRDIEFPKTVYNFKKLLNINNKNIKKYFVCYKCKSLIDNDVCNCDKESKLLDFILYKDIKLILLNFIEDNYKKLKDFNYHYYSNNNNEINDFYTSKKFKDDKKNENEFFYVLNTDGISIKGNCF